MTAAEDWGEELEPEPVHRAPPRVTPQHLARNTPAAPRTPSRDVPASEGAEQHVLACCLLEGSDTLARAVESGVTAASFYWPQHVDLFSGLKRLVEAGKPLALDILAAEMGDEAFMRAGGWPKLMEITAKVPTTVHAGYFITKLRELEQKRVLIREATRIVEAVYNGEDLAYLQTLADNLKPFSTPGKADALKEALSRRVTVSSPPAEPVTRLFLADKPIATPGNIQTFTAKTKAGKTAALGAAVASVLAAVLGTTAVRDTFKFRSSNPMGHAVIIIDTEQSPYDAWTCYKRILDRAGDPVDPPWLLHLALVGYSVSKRKAALAAVMEYAHKTFGGIFLVILDGVAHFVSSVNEIEECNTMADWIRELSITYNTAMICVIHANEGDKSGDDSRGHLGKQLMRDAESNLLLKKVGEVTHITSEKQRKAPITEADGVAFQWSDEAQRHVSCGTVSDGPKTGRPVKYDQTLMLTCVPGPGERPANVNQIHRLVGELPCGISIRSFKDWVAKWVETGEVVRVGDPKNGYGFRRNS